MDRIDALIRKLRRIEAGMIHFHDAVWITTEVPNGAMIHAEGPNLPLQKVQWVSDADHLHTLTGYVN